MSEQTRIVAFLKQELKRRGLTYRDVARSLRVSEPTVKRLFTRDRITVDRLSRLCRVLDLTLLECLERAAENEPRLAQLTVAQEQQLVADPKLLLVAVLAVNHWSVGEMTGTYRLTQGECIARLVKLERLGLIALLPGNRIRLRLDRDFQWRPDGPIRQFFTAKGQADFLNARFAGDGEQYVFLHGMLSPGALAELQSALARLRQTFADLHRASLPLPTANKNGVALLVATRSWEPRVFASLRR